MANQLVTRDTLRRQLMLNAARKPLAIGVGIAVFVAGLALGTVWLLPVALLFYLAFAASTFFDGAEAERVGQRTYERAEWLQAQTTAWLIEQAYEGALRAAEAEDLGAAQIAALQAKLVIAELGEGLLLRLGRIVGGASFSRSQPLGQWGQDLRALGFLRPPWGLAWGQLEDLLQPSNE